MAIKNVKLPPRNVGVDEVAYRDALQTHMDNVLQVYNSLVDFEITGETNQFEVEDLSLDLVKSFNIKFPDIGPILPLDNTASGTLGQTRINSDNSELEYYNGTNWVSTAPSGISVNPSIGDVRYNGGNLQHWDGNSWENISLNTPNMVRYNSATDYLEYLNGVSWNQVELIDILGITASGSIYANSFNSQFYQDSDGDNLIGVLGGETVIGHTSRGCAFADGGGINIGGQNLSNVNNISSGSGNFSTTTGTISGATLAASSQVTVGGQALNVPDYVFEPSYDLMPINAYEKYINENKHLPLIGDGRQYFKKENHKPLVSRLWETVEQQALYIVELNKRLEKLENRNIFKRIYKFIKEIIYG